MLDKPNDKPTSGDIEERADSSKIGEVLESDELIDAPHETNKFAPKEKSSFWRILGNVTLTVLQAVLMIAVLAGSIFIMKQMIAGKPKPKVRPAFKTVYTIETITAKKADNQPVFTSYGQTVAARTVDLRSLVSGEIIKVSSKLRAGAQVAKGEALVEIDDFNYQGALSEAKASLSEAQARIGENEAQISLEKGRLKAAIEQLGFAQSDLTRAKRLKSRGTSTQKELDARKLIVSQRNQSVALSRDTIKVQQSRIAQVKASIERLDWKVRQAQRNLESTVLVAPFSGIVRSSSAEIGRAITANDVVVSLYEADALEVKFTLTDAQYGRLQIAENGLNGRPVKVVWSVGGKEYIYPATIDRVGAEITSNRGGVELFALVGKTNNDVSIRPGAFVEVRVPDKVFKSTIAIPDTAIYGTQDVYVEVDGKLLKKQISIAAYDGEQAFISSGLQVGDKVLITRITEVSDGLKVRYEGEKKTTSETGG
ncbi:MAG: efflux RND transporter periplasmic adaptor subunit [Rhizobiaceae bacterium]